VIGSDGAAHRKAVTLGIQGGEDVQITSGATAGDMVITTGSYGLDEGTKVKVGPAGSEDADDAAKDKGGD
jgi:HlyD family secretion protein